MILNFSQDLSSLEKNVRADEEIAHDNSAWPLRISHPDAEDVEVESASDAASESSSSFGSAGSDPGEGEHDADQPSCESLPTSREYARPTTQKAPTSFHDVILPFHTKITPD